MRGPGHVLSLSKGINGMEKSTAYLTFVIRLERDNEDPLDLARGFIITQ